jgi:hypothetical protein
MTRMAVKLIAGDGPSLSRILVFRAISTVPGGLKGNIVMARRIRAATADLVRTTNVAQTRTHVRTRRGLDPERPRRSRLQMDSRRRACFGRRRPGSLGGTAATPWTVMAHRSESANSRTRRQLQNGVPETHTEMGAENNDRERRTFRRTRNADRRVTETPMDRLSACRSLVHQVRG